MGTPLLKGQARAAEFAEASMAIQLHSEVEKLGERCPGAVVGTIRSIGAVGGGCD